MYKKIAYLVLAALCITMVASCSGRGGKTLVSINGKKITEGDLTFLGEINPRIKAQVNSPFGRKQILDSLVEQELVYQAALKKGLQRDPMVKAKIDLYKQVIIAQAYVDAEMERAAKEYYEKNKDEFNKLGLAQIEVKFAAADDKKSTARSKDQALALANKIKVKLDAGEAFDKVAKEDSEDKATKDRGGDLGMVSKNDPRVERLGYGPMLEKAFTMKVGEISGPIETKDGYHIITVTKGAELEPFEQASQAILFKMRGEKRNEILANLKKDAKVVYADEVKTPEEKKPEGVENPEAKAPEANAPVMEAKPEQKTLPAMPGNKPFKLNVKPGMKQMPKPAPEKKK